MIETAISAIRRDARLSSLTRENARAVQDHMLGRVDEMDQASGSNGES